MIIWNYLTGSEDIITTTCKIVCPLKWFWRTETFLVLAPQPWIILNTHSSSSPITCNCTTSTKLASSCCEIPSTLEFLSAGRLAACIRGPHVSTRWTQTSNPIAHGNPPSVSQEKGVWYYLFIECFTTKIVGYTLNFSYALTQMFIQLCCYCQHIEKSCENDQKSSLVSEFGITKCTSIHKEIILWYILQDPVVVIQ